MAAKRASHARKQCARSFYRGAEELAESVRIAATLHAIAIALSQRN